MIRLLVVVLVSVGGFLAGCSTSQQANDVEPSGFLQDYSKLRPGAPGDPILFYRNPNANFLAYDKAMIDHVTIVPGPSSMLPQVPERDRRRLATLLEAKIIQAVKAEGLKVVHQPGPKVLRIRAAITEAEPSDLAMDAASTAVPLPSVSVMATGTRAFVGRATIEGEMTDSVTGEVLMAGIDRRGGGRTVQGKRNSWFHVEQAFQYWSDRFRQRLCEERSGEFCVPAE